MSKINNTSRNIEAVLTRERGIAEAEARHAALMADETASAKNLREAQSELERIEGCIAADDATAGLEDLVKADAALRFFKLQTKGKSRAVALARAAVRVAKTEWIMARVQAGEYGIMMDGLTAEGEALASQIAKLLVDYRDKCATHEQGCHRLLTDLKESDAINDEGTGNPSSPLAWGHEDKKIHKPVWISIKGQSVPAINGEYRVKRIQRRASIITEHDEQTAAKIISL